MINRGNYVYRTKWNATALTKGNHFKEMPGGVGKEGGVKSRGVSSPHSPYQVAYQILFQVAIENFFKNRIL